MLPRLVSLKCKQEISILVKYSVKHFIFFESMMNNAVQVPQDAVTQNKVQWEFYITYIESWIFPGFTSTLIPSWGKIWSLGLSLGTYLKNSCSLRYHLTLYRVSPSMSNLKGKHQRWSGHCILIHWKLMFDHCMRWDKHWFSKLYEYGCSVASN